MADRDLGCECGSSGSGGLCVAYCHECSGDDSVTRTAEHEYWMRRALRLAAEAAAAGEVPVGALVVRDGQVLGEGYNQPIGSVDPTAHAECVALRAAARTVGNYRLPGATLYVTLEPCTMCAGALVHGRVATLVFAASEPRAGAVVSRAELLSSDYLNHHVAVIGGVLEEDSRQLLQRFFRERRRLQSNDREAGHTFSAKASTTR